MNPKLLLSAIAGAIVIAAFAAPAPEKTGVILIGHEQVAAAFAKGAPLLATNNFKVQAGRRMAPGDAELHAQDTDVFYILEGSATFVTGGKPVEAWEVSPGETRAKALEGGQAQKLVKGDIIVIPNGVPHWFKEVSGPFLYYVIKVSK